MIADANATTEAERNVLKTEAARRGYRLFSLHDFVERVFFTAAYEGEATVVGFNLPYDLSRLALEARRAPACPSSQLEGRGGPGSTAPWSAASPCSSRRKRPGRTCG